MIYLIASVVFCVGWFVRDHYNVSVQRGTGTDGRGRKLHAIMILWEDKS